MSGAEVHHIDPPDDAEPPIVAATRSLSFELEYAINKLTGVMSGIEDEINRWRNGQYVGGCSCSDEPRSIVQHGTALLTSLDEYGRAPIVHVLVESVPGLVRVGEREYDVIAHAVDANGDTWPMVRSASSPRPYLVRDYEGLEEVAQ